MKLDEKRKVVEVLLCAAGARWAVCEVARAFMPPMSWLDQACTDLWFDAFRLYVNDPKSHDLSSIEAAYRLIESSPTLRREWFGAA